MQTFTIFFCIWFFHPPFFVVSRSCWTPVIRRSPSTASTHGSLAARRPRSFTKRDVPWLWKGTKKGTEKGHFSRWTWPLGLIFVVFLEEVIGFFVDICWLNFDLKMCMTCFEKWAVFKSLVAFCCAGWCLGIRRRLVKALTYSTVRIELASIIPHLLKPNQSEFWSLLMKVKFLVCFFYTHSLLVDASIVLTIV